MPLIVGTAATDINITQQGSLALGSSLLVHGQILLSSSSAGLIIAANANRRYLAIFNGGSFSVFLGSSTSVTGLTGFELTSGSGIDFNRQNEQYTGQIAGITLNSSATVSYLEV